RLSLSRPCRRRRRMGARGCAHRGRRAGFGRRAARGAAHICTGGVMRIRTGLRFAVALAMAFYFDAALAQVPLGITGTTIRIFGGNGHIYSYRLASKFNIQSAKFRQGILFGVVEVTLGDGTVIRIGENLFMEEPAAPTQPTPTTVSNDADTFDIA